MQARQVVQCARECSFFFFAAYRLTPRSHACSYQQEVGVGSRYCVQAGMGSGGLSCLPRSLFCYHQYK